MARGQTELTKAQVELGNGQAELKGQLSVILTWMQSMDQRFTALMHPFEPPPKNAATR